MDALPNELWSLILQQLSFKDLAKVSMVCKKFNALAMDIFSLIQQLQVREDTFYNRLRERSFILFQSVDLFTIGMIDKLLLDSLFDFLANRCPNLSVLDAPGVRISLETLKRLSNKLKYFSFYFITNFNSQAATSFPNLIAFDLISDHFKGLYGLELENFRQKLINKNSGFIQRSMPLDSLDTFSSTVKSLVISTTNFANFTLPVSLTGTLELLTINNVKLGPGVEFPKLISLMVNGCAEGILASALSTVRQSKQLQVLSFECGFDDDLFSDLSQLLSQSKSMRAIKFLGVVSSHINFRIEVGPNLHYLDITLELPLTLVSNSSPKLKTLHVDTLSIDLAQFDLSSLVILNLRSTVAPNICQITFALSKALSLEKFYFDCREEDTKITSEEVTLMVKKNCIPASGVKNIVARKRICRLVLSWTDCVTVTSDLEKCLPKKFSGQISDFHYSCLNRTQQLGLVFETIRESKKVLKVSEVFGQLTQVLTSSGREKELAEQLVSN